MNNISEKKRMMLANLLLLVVGAIWGGGFVVMKNALDNIPVNYLLAMRFTVGALGLSYTLFSKRHPLTRRAVWGGVCTGAFIYGGYAVQTYGLAYTTAGNSALITALYVVLVPFIVWLRSKKRPDGRMFMAAPMMLVGIALLSLQNDMSIGIGEILTLICSIFYAVHIICVDEFSEEVEVMQLTCLQFTFAAIFAWLAAVLFEGPFPQLDSGNIGELAYCGVCATLVALTLMNVGIKYGDPTYASLFMSSEGGFGCLFGVIFLNEVLTGRMGVGCVLILLSLVISQVDWGVVFSKKKGMRNERV